MRSSRPVNRATRQRGFGLVEVLVGVGLLAVAIVVLLGSLSTLLVGARTAERRTVEARLARNEIESVMSSPTNCSPSKPVTIDSTNYVVVCSNEPTLPGLVKFTVTVRDPSGASLALSVDRVQLGGN